MGELQRLKTGPKPAEEPDGLLLALHAFSTGHSREVLARTIEVMLVIASHADPWPDLDSWRHLLPSWFVERCAREGSKEEARRQWRT